MKQLIVFFALPLLSGCLSPASMPEVSRWSLEYGGAARTAKDAKFGVGRVSQVIVRTPYGTESIPVLRADGSIAFDPYNEFAALPSALVKGVVFDAMEGSGLFENVLNASSAATSSVSVEVMVLRLALDCRQEGSRRAVAKVLVRLLKSGNNEIVGLAKGEGAEDAADGNYGKAFSRALSMALSTALGQFR